MRITGGSYLNRRITCPPGIIRPAMDRMRESAFSILGDLYGLSFLDLFSGSGIIGFEAASRGASPVVLVEGDRKKRQTILANIRQLEAPARLVLKPAERYLSNPDGTFDLVFLDPPFNYPNKEKLLEKVGSSGCCTEAGTVMIHYPRENELPETIGPLSRFDERQYGRSMLAFYGVRYQEETP
ncbi:MAG: 16S rRNA (guanine(966)-N(2))-methyltransferase RsmD [Spirochaetales bacterium]|nr:16S rRNA (guanine(966)-N(2))-methyltransferase RsmD [Spirochaetales bacterium]MCF7937074.1 16S rRNA (guanine(966)-N(2))-methyltransferase RsmD [Spirochaetales bacterium]